MGVCGEICKQTPDKAQANRKVRRGDILKAGCANRVKLLRSKKRDDAIRIIELSYLPR